MWSIVSGCGVPLKNPMIIAPFVSAIASSERNISWRSKFSVQNCALFSGSLTARLSARPRQLLLSYVYFGAGLTVYVYLCCPSRVMSVGFPFSVDGENSRPMIPGLMVINDVVPSGFLRVATGVLHIPN